MREGEREKEREHGRREIKTTRRERTGEGRKGMEKERENPNEKTNEVGG